MHRILKVIIEGHPSRMLPYPRVSPLICLLMFEKAGVQYITECSYGVYHMIRILEVIIEGRPCGMLPYPRLSPCIVLLILKSQSPG